MLVVSSFMVAVPMDRLLPRLDTGTLEGFLIFPKILKIVGNQPRASHPVLVNSEGQTLLADTFVEQVGAAISHAATNS